jgi:U3 small nucleolar RNA-associated protein 20
MLIVVGNTLYSTSTPVLALGLKCVAAIVKCPLKSLEKSLPVFIRQTIDIIKQTGSAESEVTQTALKSLATIFRDCPSAQVKEKDLVYLLEFLSPDLEEPSRQASVFTMLRAIVSRKFVVPEIYDLMDKVSEIMVTSHSPQVQELCRAVLLQFLLDYPQGKGRLRNQMSFLAKNLSYVYESGRKSVMELLGAIVTKFEVGLVREYADLLFVALVMVLGNDDSAKCKEMASELIKNILARLDDDHRRTMMSHLHSWSAQHSQPQLTRISSQVYGLVIDVLQLDVLPYLPSMLEDLNTALELSAQRLASIERGDQMEVDLEWQVPYQTLSVLSKVLQVFPDLTTTPNKVIWSPVVAHLLFTHAWVRTAACRLLGLLFTAVPAVAPQCDLPDDSPLSRIGMQNVAKQLCLQLKSDHLDARLSLQIVKNLFYIGKCLCAIPVAVTVDTEDATDEEFDEATGDKMEAESQSHDPLPWLFSKLSYQIKSAHIARRNRTFSSVSGPLLPRSIRLC